MSGRSRWSVVAALAALLVVVGAPTAGAQVSAPNIKPSIADPGDTVSVSGSFETFCIAIEVALDGAPVMRMAPPNGVPNGSYDVLFVVPRDTRDGDHIVQVACSTPPGVPTRDPVLGGLTTPATRPPTTTTSTTTTTREPERTTTTTAVEVIPTSPTVTTGPEGPEETTRPTGPTGSSGPTVSTGITGSSRTVPPTVTESTDIERTGPTTPSSSATSSGTTRPGETTVPGTAPVPTATGPSTTTGPTATTEPEDEPDDDPMPPATIVDDSAGLELDRPAVAPGGDVTATGKGCRPGTPVEVTAGTERVGRATADASGGFRSPLDTQSLKLGRHRLQANCGTLLEADLDIVLVADVGGTGPSMAFIWIVILLAIALSQAHPWKRARRTSVR